MISDGSWGVIVLGIGRELEGRMLAVTASGLQVEVALVVLVIY
jgi:hypothetical protein